MKHYSVSTLDDKTHSVHAHGFHLTREIPMIRFYIRQADGRQEVFATFPLANVTAFYDHTVTSVPETKEHA